MKRLILTQLILSLAFIVNAQHGKVCDNLTLKSKILKMERKYAIYLPPDYETSNRSYPVLYLLHGAGDDQSGWIQFGEVNHIADKAIHEGYATPMIIVMPNAETGLRGYTNDVSGNWRYEDFFFEEFIPFIEKQYRIRNNKRYRAVAGNSMGGGGTFFYALHRPEMFSVACPMSASIMPVSLQKVDIYMKLRGLPDASNEKKAEWFERHNILDLIRKIPANEKWAVRWYIDCGDDDHLYEPNSLVHIEMRKNEIPHEFRIRDGGHSWSYWRESLPDVLHFISENFHQH